MLNKKIKILFLTGTYAVGGKERQLTELISHLPQDKYEIHLFVKVSEAYYFEMIQDKLTSFYSLEKNKFSIFDVFKVAQYINQVKPDVVHSWATLTSHFVALSKLLTSHHFRLINGAIRDAPVILPLSFKLEAFLYSFYKIVVSNSKAGLKTYHQIDTKNRYVVPNGIDLNRIPEISYDECREHLKWRKDKFIVTMVACMAERKDYDTFIHAAHHCLKQDKNIFFMLVGDGSEKERLMKLAFSNNEFEYSQQIYFLGERSDIEELFIASDVSVLMSAKWHGEGIPNTVMESMACGTPVIASDNGGTNEIVEDGISGFLVDCGDELQLANKILFLKNNPKQLKKLGYNACTTIKNKFTISKMVNLYEELYENALAFNRK